MYDVIFNSTSWCLQRSEWRRVAF